MNRKFQLLYLIEQYCRGQYDTKTFSSHMARIFYIERDDSLSQAESNLMAPLAHCADYFSPHQKDHELYEGFTNESTVKQTALVTYQNLILLYGRDCFDEWIQQALSE